MTASSTKFTPTPPAVLSLTPTECAAQRSTFTGPPPIPAHIKRMRHLLLLTVLCSAASIWMAIPLSIKSHFVFAASVPLALWTLVLLYDQEMGHLDYKPEIREKVWRGTKVVGERVVKEKTEEQRWVVDERVRQKAGVTAKAWAASAVKSAAVIGGLRVGGREVMDEAWVCVVLEAVAAGALWKLGSMWEEEGRKRAEDVKKRDAEQKK